MVSVDNSLPIKLKVWDRFIRSGRDLKKRHICLAVDRDKRHGDAAKVEDDRILFRKLYSGREEAYKGALAATLGVPAAAPPEGEGGSPWQPTWPVRHRPVPSVGSPNAVLDLPNIRNDFCSSIMDWSSTNLVTVGFPRSVHVYHAGTQSVFRIPEEDPICVKWEHRGAHLFVANIRGKYKLLDFERTVVLASGNEMPCHRDCFAICSAFHPYSHLLFVGCSRGAITMFDYKNGLKVEATVRECREPITALAFSCDGKHLAATTMAAEVSVYESEFMCPVMAIKMGAPSRAVAWHPWRPRCLVVADSQSFMAMYDVAHSTAPEASYVSSYNCSILGLLFSQHTAELVISQRIYGYVDGLAMPQVAQTQLNVVASFDRVVDRLEGHAGRVLNMCWNPDGTQLATAGSEETVRMWDFLPRNMKQRTSLSGKQSNRDLSYASSSLELANRLGLVISAPRVQLTLNRGLLPHQLITIRINNAPLALVASFFHQLVPHFHFLMNGNYYAVE